MKRLLLIVLSITLVMSFSTTSFGVKTAFGADENVEQAATEESVQKNDVERQKEEQVEKKMPDQTTLELPQLAKKALKGAKAPKKSAVKKMKNGDSQTSFLGYTLTVSDDGYILIPDFENLAIYALVLTVSQGSRGRLTNDITFPSDSTSATICNLAFTGEFDGNGKTLNIGNSEAGLFIDNSGTIKNLKVKYNQVINNSAQQLGVFANTNNGTIKNCIAEGNDMCASDNIGAFAGKCYGSILDCISIINGNMYSFKEAAIGGITGFTVDSGLVEGCITKGSGKIYDAKEGCLGGICGFNGGSLGDASGVIRDCVVEGSLTLEVHKRDELGGIVGNNSSYSGGTISCLTTGNVKITGKEGLAVGGIAGKIERYFPNNFYNSTGGVTGGDIIEGQNRNGAILGLRTNGGTAGCKYNTDKYKGENNGYGTAISNIYWLDKDAKVKVSVKDDGSDGFICARRYFYYGDQTVNYEYDGTLGANQYANFKLNNNDVVGGSFTMPKQDSTLRVSVVTIKPISDVAPYISGTFTYNGNNQKPTSVSSSDGTLQEGKDYTVTIKNSQGQTVTQCVNADQYTMTLTGIKKYKGTHNIGFTINKANPSVTAPTAKDLTYNGESQDLITEGSTNEGTISYKLEGGSWGDSIPQGTDAGPYIVYYKVDGDSNHNSIGETKILANIKPADAEFTKNPVAKTQEYTGESLSLLEDNGEAEGGTIYYKVGDGEYSTTPPEGTDAKSYKITCYVKGDNNHNDSAEYELTAVIEPSNATLTKEPVAKDLTYNGKDQALVTLGECTGGKVVYSLDATADSEFSEEVPAMKDAGTYEVFYMIQGDDNHVDSEILGPVKVTIKKADVKVTAPKKNKLKYLAKNQELVTAGITEDGTLMYATKKNGTYSEKIPTGYNAGTYYVYWMVKGDKNHNDYVAEKPIKVKIKATGATLYKLTPKGKKIKVEWYAMVGAQGYDVFFAKCGKKYKLYKTVGANKLSLTIKGLKKKGSYKVKIKAWSTVDGQREYIKSYPLVHTYTVSSTKRFTVPKAVKVNTSSVTLEKGKTFQVVAKVVKKNKKKKLMREKHSPMLRYFSTEKDVATIDAKGLITAIGQGTCTAYAYSVNGKYKPITVTVK